MPTDAELLRRYSDERSEEAFSELVRRHIDFVFSTALRQVGSDSHLAADVSQYVFTQVARKAGALADHRALKGWLYTTTRHAAANVVRGERRRRVRELEAQTMHELNAPTAEMTSDDLRPVIDQAIGTLGTRDREALLLRFFEDVDYREIGVRYSISSDAARLRVERTLEKIRVKLTRNGIASTTAALAGTLATQAAITAPLGLATSVTSTVLTEAAAGSGAIALLAFMSTTKTIIILLAVAVVAIVPTLYQVGKTHRAETALVALARDRDGLANRVEAQAKQIKQLQDRVAALGGKAPVGDDRTSGSGNRSGADEFKTVIHALMANPQYRKLESISMKGQLGERYEALFKSLALAPDQLAKFQNLLVEKVQVAADAVTMAIDQELDATERKQAVKDAQAPLNDQIKAILGDAGYGQYQQYDATLPERNAVNQLQQSLSYTSNPLTDSQINQMIPILQQTDPTPGQDAGLQISVTGILSGNVATVITDQTLKMAQAVLSPPQLQAFQQIQSQQQAQQQLLQIVRATSTPGGKTGRPTP